VYNGALHDAPPPKRLTAVRFSYTRPTTLSYPHQLDTPASSRSPTKTIDGRRHGGSGARDGGAGGEEHKSGVVRFMSIGSSILYPRHFAWISKMYPEFIKI
jgi:hypothetical protein